MKSPRFLGSRFLFWLVAPWVLLGIVAFIFVAKMSFEDGRKVAGMVAGCFAFLCALGAFAMVSTKHGLACGRIVAGTLTLAYVAYFAHTFFIEGQSLQPTGRRSDATPFNAICGFIVIGLPCALFAITGVPFWRMGARGGANPIAPCEPADVPVICEIINQSALAYKGVIPADRWHEPYMPLAELEAEIARGVRFFGFRLDGALVGVMGIQDVKDVTLIRHAYVRPECRSKGIGGALLDYLYQLSERPVLIGTWRAATWAIRFYEKNGFTLVSDEEKQRLLNDLTIPDRQVEESVVLVDEQWRDHPANSA